MRARLTLKFQRPINLEDYPGKTHKEIRKIIAEGLKWSGDFIYGGKDTDTLSTKIVLLEDDEMEIEGWLFD